MFRFLRNLTRLFYIAYVFARHDALFLLKEIKIFSLFIVLTRPLQSKKKNLRPGQRLAEALTCLGPIFIKLGQTLSVRSDIVGEEVARDLSHLQDKLPPFSIDTVHEIIEKELDKPIDEIFEFFDKNPIAAASISQVHKATTIEGQAVAVKVLRPNIKKNFEKDISLFFWMARLIEKTQPRLRRFRPVESVLFFQRTVEIELDLKMEAAAGDELRENFQDEPLYSPPKIYWDYTSSRVLTLEWAEGISIDEKDQLIEAGHNVNDILKKSAECFFYQVFRDGFFHADMHGGNAFVGKGGVIIPIDYGIMGRVDNDLRMFLAEMLLGLLKGNYDLIADVHFRLGFVPKHISYSSFRQACRAIGAPIVGKSSSEISYAKLLGDIIKIMERYDIIVQPELLLLQKSMLMAEGMGQTLNSEVNIWDMAKPLIEEWMRIHYGPEAIIARQAKKTYDAFIKLPDLVLKLEKFLDKNQGNS